MAPKRLSPRQHQQQSAWRIYHAIIVIEENDGMDPRPTEWGWTVHLIKRIPLAYLPILRIFNLVSVFFISPTSPSFDHRRQVFTGHHNPHLKAYGAFGFRAEGSKVDMVFSI